MSWVTVFKEMGKGAETEKMLRKGLGSWWLHGYMCHRMVSHVFFRTALTGSVFWPWSVAKATKRRHWESKVLRLTFRPKTRAGEDWVKKVVAGYAGQRETVEPAGDGKKCRTFGR